MISWGSPCCTISPSRRIEIRSPMRSASSRSWVMKTMVLWSSSRRSAGCPACPYGSAGRAPKRPRPSAVFRHLSPCGPGHAAACHRTVAPGSDSRNRRVRPGRSSAAHAPWLHFRQCLDGQSVGRVLGHGAVWRSELLEHHGLFVTTELAKFVRRHGRNSPSIRTWPSVWFDQPVDMADQC